MRRIDKKDAPDLTAKALDQFTLFGVGDFVEPIVYGVKGEVLEGTITYQLGTDHYPNKAAVLDKLKTMAAGASLPSLQYVFDPTSDNYLGSKVGNFTITVKAKADVSAQIAFSDGELTYNGSAQTYEKASIDGITPGANPKWSYTYTAVSGTLDSGKPKAASTFADVPANAFCADAVAWAVKKGITNGKANGLFGSSDPCTRGQIVTFLYRAPIRASKTPGLAGHN